MKRASLGVLLAGMAALAGALFVTGSLSETPKTVIERFLDGMQDMSEQKILSTIDPAVRKQERPKVDAMLEGFRALTARGARLRITDRRIQIEANNGSVCGARVSYTLAVESGGQTRRQDFHEKMMLFRDQGRWYRKINGLRSP